MSFSVISCIILFYLYLIYKLSAISLFLTRKALFEIYVQKKELDHLREYMRNVLSVETLSPEDDYAIRQLYEEFCKEWRDIDRSKYRFLNKYSTWVDCTIAFRTVAISSTFFPIIGKPKNNFEKCSEQTKRRKTEDIRKSSTDSELIYATQMCLRGIGHTMLANILQEMIGNPSKIEELIACWKKDKVQINKYSEDKELTLLMRNRLSKRTYCDIQKGNKRRGANIYPLYNQILSVKERCYPAKSSIKVTESSARIFLQALLDLSIQRILQTMRLPR